MSFEAFRRICAEHRIMNRTLRRPMFRMGGAAEGITSGLDT